MAPHPLSPAPNEVRIGKRVLHLDPERKFSTNTPAYVECLKWLSDSASAEKEAEAELFRAVWLARQLGISWQVIGEQLGVSKQAANARFTERVRDLEAAPR